MLYKRTDNTAFGRAKIMQKNKAKIKKTNVEGCEMVSIFRHKRWGDLYTNMPKKRKRVKYNNRDENVLLTKHDIMIQQRRS